MGMGEGGSVANSLYVLRTVSNAGFEAAQAQAAATGNVPTTTADAHLAEHDSIASMQSSGQQGMSPS